MVDGPEWPCFTSKVVGTQRPGFDVPGICHNYPRRRANKHPDHRAVELDWYHFAVNASTTKHGKQ